MPAALMVLGALLLATAGALGLFESTETRYAEIAREMLTGGNWLIPFLDGLHHFHKPPLAYWATAAGFAAFGVNGWGARVPAALAALATLAFTTRIARRFAPSLEVTPGIAVWILGSSLMFFVLGRSLATDPFLTAAVAGFWALAPSPIALGLLGAGFLAKGPVVLALTALPLLAAAAWERRPELLGWLGPRRGWALFALIALPWYLLVVARTPGLLAYFLRHQLWERYATTVHQRGGPPWYFVAVLIGGLLPWTPALLAGISRAWRARERREARLLLCWLGAPLVFFSLSGSKLPSYLLPCLPAAALLAALGLAGGARATRRGIAALLAGIALAGWVLGPAWIGRGAGLVPPVPVPLPPAAHVALVFMAAAAGLMLLARPAGAALLVALSWTALVVAAAPYEGALGSPRPLARLLIENRAGEEPVVEYGRFNAGLPFYLGRTVRLLDVPREAGFEDPARLRDVLLTPDSLVALVGRAPRVWLLGPESRSAALAATLGLHYQPMARWQRLALASVSR